MTNKKQGAKRLVIFLVLAYAIAWIPWIIMNANYDFKDWFMSGDGGVFMWLTLLTGGAPAIAAVLTRLITKEGLYDGMLRLKLRGNIKYYVIALLVPLAGGLIRGAVLLAGLNTVNDTLSPLMRSSLVMQAFWMSLVMAFNTFGEEYGWRAYMNPKMESLMGKPAAVIVGGILWGVWHAPLTVVGHNFGTDYWGFPWLGIVMMSGYCICTGMFLMWLTQKSGSVYPAAIAHAANNNGSLYMAAAVSGGLTATAGAVFSEALAGIAVQAAIYALFGVLLVLDSRRKKIN
ncbi:MAG: CPBP family intramembrane metalloprotease [Oscillospiraceae bacterium]|nr:CPBP family intramembrane metalloprotease [Oscillospiraceae bacterium]